MKTWIRSLIDILIVIGIILGVAYAMGLLTGFAKGGDTYGYLTKIRLIDAYFPHINWNPFWDSGTPFSIWSYPPLPMTATTFIFVKLLGLTAERALTVMAAFSFCLLGVGIYGFVSEVTGKRLAGLLAVVLFVSSPASWNWWSFGNYVRVFGMGFFGLSLWVLAGYFKRFLAGKDSKAWFLATLFFTALAVSSHLLVGGITLVVVFLYVLFAVPSFDKKLSYWLKFFIFPFLTAAYWYLPLLLTGKAGGRFIGINPAYPIPVLNWFYPVNAQEDFSLSPVLSLAFLGGFLLILISILFKRVSLSKFAKASLWVFGIFIFGNTVYNSAGFLPFYPETFYIVGFAPITAFSLLSITWAIGAGLFLGFLSKLTGKVKIINFALLGIFLIGILSVFWGLEYLKKTVRDLTAYGMFQDLSQQVIKVDDGKDFNHRFGTDSGLVGDWFTYRYDMPQTRDYFAQGIPHINWQNWMETAVWAWKDNWNETKFLLDWYAIKYIFVGEPHFNFSKFLSQPDDFSVYQTKTFSVPAITLMQFKYNHSAEIMTATNAPTMLVISSESEYDVFLRSLALAGFDSKKVIPIFSDQKVDSFSPTELKKFEAIFLYNYSYDDQRKMDKILGEYLQGGGKIIVDSFRGKEMETHKTPGFFPITSTEKADVNKDWGFINQESKFLEGVNLTKFAEATYRGNPWHVSLANRNGLTFGTKIILENNQGIMMAAKEEGAGKVIWSGINFPFHIADKKNEEEIKLWQNLMSWLGLDQEFAPIMTRYQFIHPEKRETQVLEPARGLLFKETNFMDWRAPSKLYFAGPGFMYVFLNQEKFPQTIKFEYRLSLLEKTSFGIAILAWLYFALLLIEALFKKSIISRKISGLFTKRGGKVFSQATSWWDKEEE
ncbi:hypothetical protein HY439_03550 [Candidatus Microgenomates bacterium]|nr:hypothetical protein [Candidatus Microgenomates bacterium]